MKKISKCPHCGAPIYEVSQEPLEIKFSCDCRSVVDLARILRDYRPYIPPPIVIERPYYIPTTPWSPPYCPTISWGDSGTYQGSTARTEVMS